MTIRKTLLLAAIGLLIVILAAGTYVVMTERPGTRSIALISTDAPAIPQRVKSTGLFVGVSEFGHETPPVPFAVDDAIDLAHRFSLDQRSSLIPPRNVVLALSGKPKKEESKRRLVELKAAGAKVEEATSGDIMQLLKKQVARAGSNGLVVLSIASHGYLDDDGDAYILGSASEIGSPETSLRAARLLDLAGKAPRSLVFIDACRNRADASTRSGSSSAKTVAPLLDKMKHIQGQVVFYAAAADQVAYDDFVNENGVFTKAVLEGMNCNASAPHGFVTAGTLNTHVERTVREWIMKNKHRVSYPATQFSKEGSAHNMRLADCWRPPKFRIRAEIDGSRVTAYDDASRQLWRKDFHAPVIDVRAADLDADALYEVVAATAAGITAFNREGQVLWHEPGDGMRLVTFTTADLFEKHTNQIVALWTDGRISRLTTIGEHGKELERYERNGRLLEIAVGRWTNSHDPRIAVTTPNSLFLLKPKNLKSEWERRLASNLDAIQEMSIVGKDTAKYRSIVVRTKRVRTLFDFEGHTTNSDAGWLEFERKKKSSRKPRD